jgi:hypothetical protein
MKKSTQTNKRAGRRGFLLWNGLALAGLLAGRWMKLLPRRRPPLAGREARYYRRVSTTNRDSP